MRKSVPGTFKQMRKSVPGTFIMAPLLHLVDGGLDNRVKHPFDQGSDKDREVDHFVQVCSVATNLGAPSQCNNAKRGTHV
jgi:hypothetical protein